jgi:transcriptional regulator with GAF, ATPase, and Fis domain
MDVSEHLAFRLSRKLAEIEARSGRLRRSEQILAEVRFPTEWAGSVAIARLTNALFIGDPEAIKHHIRRVQRLSSPTQAQVKFACLLARGVAHLHSGRPDLAAKQCRAAHVLNAEKLQNGDFDAEARLRLAEALLASGAQPGRALRQVEELVAGLGDLQNPVLQAEIHRVHATALRRNGDPDGSDAAYEAAYALTTQMDRSLYRYFALRDHAEFLLDELRQRAGADTLLRRVLADMRACVRRFDHPVFGWHLRVLEALANSRLAPDPEIAELDECRDALRAARAAEEISAHHHDTWLARLDAELEAARRRLRESLARDVAAMDEVVAGLRSEDLRGHLQGFIRSICERLGGERAAMVIEHGSDEPLDVVVAHGMKEPEAAALARALMPILGPDDPVLIRDLASPTDPLAATVRQALAGQEGSGSLDGAIAGADGAARSALAFAIDGGGTVVGLIYLDRALQGGRLPFRSADLRDFAFLANGLAAVSRLASARAQQATRVLQDRLRGVTRRWGIVTRSALLMRVLERMERIAATDMPLLILGESGTGKELVARAAHQASKRADGPFIAVNCAAIPATLMEAELFGHRRGAFTGADHARAGLLLAANGGTLFLDEIGELAADLQAKLLRVLENHQVTPLGGTQSVTTDFRVVAATNASLEEAVARGTFRADLYYRLRGFTVTLPPLRDRPEDIRLLADYFLDLQAIADGSPEGSYRFTAEAYRTLERHRWPGNVRELRLVVQSAAVLRDPEHNEIGLDALMESVLLADGHGVTREQLDAALLGRIATVADALGTPDLLKRIEAHLVARALQRSGGNQRAAARALSMRESTLRKRMQAMQVTSGEGRDL